MSKKWQDATDQIIKSLDLRAEFCRLGVEIVGEPTEEGWAAARAVGRADNNPSAGVNLITGRYHDFGGNGENLSLFEFSAHVGKFPDWKEARKHYAKVAGVKLPKGRESSKPDDKLEFCPWNEMLVFAWCDKKPGISPEAVRKAGGRLARWPSTGQYKVLAFPIYGIGGLNSDPVGYTLYNITGGTLPDAQGNPRKMLLAGGSTKGWIGQWGLANLSKCDVVIKVEGTPDLLAVMTARDNAGMTDVAVLSNSHGSTENPKEEMCSLFAGKVVYTIHDADIAGVAGAAKWAACIANFAKESWIAKLPYTIQPDHGFDVRDFLTGVQEGTQERARRSYSTLLDVLTGGEQVLPPERPKTPEERPHDDLSIEKGILSDIGIQVLGELDKGAVKVFCEYHRKTDVITDVSKMTFHRLLQLGGPPIRGKVHNGQDDIPGMYDLRTVKEAISVVAGFTRIGDESELGRGIWRGKDDRGEDTDNLILVGAGEAVIRNGRPELLRVTSPKYAGRLLDISASHPWFEYSILQRMFTNATANWMADAVRELEELLALWRWADQGQAPKVAAGLILATWIQTLWDWRPQVVVTGKSGSGKSTFFQQFLNILFGPICVSSSSSTAAGVQQKLQSTAEICLLDEFDSIHPKEREKLLELLRMAGRGDNTLKGTPGLKGKRLTLRHIVWAAGIEDGLKREPDVNRFINLNLVKPPASEMGKLNDLPGHRELGDLGQRLLVVAVKIAFEAKELATALRREKIPGADYRVVESFAVPAACYSVVFPDAGPARGVLQRMLAIVDREIEDDEQQLLESILDSSVFYHQKHSSIAAAIEDILSATGSTTASETIEAAGVGVVENYNQEGRYLFIRSNTVKRKLLRNTEWEGRNLDQILLRIDGAERYRHRMAGSQYRGIKIPFSSVDGLREDSAGNSESPF